MQMMASIGIGSVQPGQGRVPSTAGARPSSSYRSLVDEGAAAAACLAAAGLAAVFAEAGLAAAAAAFAGGAGVAPPGIFSGFWQPGHLTVLPASSSLAAKALPQAHWTLMGMSANSLFAGN